MNKALIPTAELPLLEQQIKKNISVFAFYPFVLLMLLVVFIVVLLSSYRSHVVSSSMVSELRHSIVHVGQREAALINQQLVAVRDLLKSMRPQHQYFLSLPRTVDLQLTAAEPVFGRDSYGAFYKQQDNGGSTLYYSAHTDIDAEQYWKARNTELLDDLYKTVVEDSDIVDQAYFNSWDNMSRIYPFIPKADKKFGLAPPVVENNFYYLATPEHNPDKDVVWTSTYLDPFGMGNMVSAVMPIYTGDFLEGVVGLDVTLTTMLHTIFDRAYLTGRHVMLLDKNHNIVAASDQISSLLHLVISNPAATTPNPGHNLNLSQHQQVNTALLQWLPGQQSLLDLRIEKQDFVLSKTAIPETRWQLVVLQKVAEITLPVQSVERTEILASLTALFILLSCGAAYFFFVFKKARMFSASLVIPIRQLTGWTALVGAGRQLPQIADQNCTIAEIKCLMDHFSFMATELSDRNDKLMQAQIAHQVLEEKARNYQQMAHTDQLTGLHNRKYMDSVLKFQTVRVSVSASNCCIMLLDVDHFKQVNDCHGHQMGDLVLQKVSTALSALLRPNDVIARWGGEEFLLLCPNTAIDEAIELAERLRCQIEQLQLLPQRAVTVSIGIAQMRKNERAEQTIARADVMLYKSKHSGRNQVNAEPTDHN